MIEKDEKRVTIPDFDINPIVDEITKSSNEISKSFKNKTKKKMMYIEKNKTFKKCISVMPEKGESLHIINNSKFDFYTVIPFVNESFGKIEELYISTWVASRDNLSDLFKRFDQGKIINIKILTGLYFKTRESGVYGYLMKEGSKRKVKTVSFRNHAKILLIKIGKNYFIIEGSANLNANPRLEQYIITNDEKLYLFHKKWMEDKINE